MEGVSFCVLLVLHVCPSFDFLVKPMDFRLGGCVAADLRMCYVKCELLRATGHIHSSFSRQTFVHSGLLDAWRTYRPRPGEAPCQVSSCLDERLLGKLHHRRPSNRPDLTRRVLILLNNPFQASSVVHIS